MTAGEFVERLFPDFTQADFDLEAVRNLFAFGRVEFGEAAGQEFCEDLAEIAVYLGPCLVKRFFLVFVEGDNGLLDLSFVPDHGLHHVLQRRLLLLDTVDHVHNFGVDLLLHALEALR